MKLDSILAFLGPAVVPVLLLALASLAWHLVSALFNTLYDRYSPHTDEEWAAAFARHPRWTAIVSIAKTSGWNIPGQLRSLRTLFGGPLPAPIQNAIAGRKVVTTQDLKEIAQDAGDAAKEVALDAAKPKAALPPGMGGLMGLLVFCVLVGACVSGCSGMNGDTKAGVKTAIDVSDAVCKELDKDLQDEPSALKFACSIVEQGSGLSKVFLMKARRDDPVSVFSMKKCTAPEGGVSP